MTKTLTRPARRSLTLDVDRWRFRDAAGTIRSSQMFDVALDAPTGTPIAYGVAPIAAGLANGQHWAAVLSPDDSDSPDPVLAYHRRAEITVRYGDVLARVGERLTITTDSDEAGITSTVETPAGLVASIRQVWQPATVVDEGLTANDKEAPPGAQMFTRVRLGRWVYISGELTAVHGNHVAATAAQLPAAVVPESLLAGIAERALFAGNTLPSGELRVRSSIAILAGDWGVVEPGTGRALTLHTCRGAAVEASRT